MHQCRYTPSNLESIPSGYQDYEAYMAGCGLLAGDTLPLDGETLTVLEMLE